jgi:hypothetical protein
MKPFLNIYEIDLVDRLKLEDEFFAQGFLMSYSGLNRLLYSPGAFYQHYILKQREDQTDKAMAEGKLIHCLLLNPEKFEDEFVVLPNSFPSDNPKRVIERVHAHITETYPQIEDVRETMLPYLTNVQNTLLDILKDENLHQTLKTDQQRLDRMLTEKNMEYLDFLLKRKGRTVVEKDMVTFAERVRETFSNNVTMRKLMGMNNPVSMSVHNETELVMFSDYEFGIRGIIDNLVVDHDQKVIRVNDLKKTSKPLALFGETVEYYKYWMQAAIYKMIVDNVKQTTYGVDYPVEFRFLVVDPYMQIAPVKVSEETMSKYMEMTINALNMANRHFQNKDFTLPYHGLTFAESDHQEFLL